MRMKSKTETALIKILRWPRKKNLDDIKTILEEDNITPWGGSLFYPDFVTVPFNPEKKLYLHKKIQKLSVAGFFVKKVQKA